MPNFQQFSETTTCHGFLYLHNAPTRWSKFGWILIMAFSTFTLFSSIIGIFNKFTDTDKQWTTEFKSREKPYLNHPTITLCNFNRIKRSKAHEFQFSDDLISYFYSAFSANYPFRKDFKTSDPVIQRYKNWKTVKQLNYSEILQKMSFTCEEMVVYADSGTFVVGKNFCMNSINSSYNVTPKLTSDFGLCQQIIVSSEVQMSDGAQRSTTLILDTRPNEYLTLLENNYLDVGFVIQLNYGKKMELGKWISVTPGVHSWISMQQSRVETALVVDSFAQLLDPCNMTPTLQVVPDEYYSKKNCHFDCLMEPLVRKCQCFPLTESKRYPICEIEDWQKCNELFFMTFNKTEYSANYELCKEYRCMATCNTTNIITSVSTSQLLTRQQLPAFEKILAKKGLAMDLSEIQQRIAMVDIYYSTTSITTIEYGAKMTFSSMWSDVGGIWGATFGISTITIIHMFVFCCSACCSCCKWCCNRGKKLGQFEPKNTPKEEPNNLQTAHL